MHRESNFYVILLITSYIQEASKTRHDAMQGSFVVVEAVD